MSKPTVLSLAYLGNIQYYTKLCTRKCVIDTHEHYVKQSYRNRCDILTVNGPTALTAHVVRPSNANKSATRDIRLDHSKRWMHQHWMSLVSSYGKSPYYDYYADRFAPLYARRYEFLLDLDLDLMNAALDLIGSKKPVHFAESYIDPQEPVTDLRDGISPKPRLAVHDPEFEPQHYYQVFDDRMEFVPNLSIIDLLMCEGPNTLNILLQSVK